MDTMRELKERFRSIEEENGSDEDSERYHVVDFLSLFDGDGDCIWTARKASDEIGCSYSTARRWLGRLEANDVLHSEVICNDCRVYTMKKTAQFPHTKMDWRKLIDLAEGN